MSGSSPEMTFTATPASANDARTAPASARSSSAIATRPSARMPAGRVASASSSCGGRASASSNVATSSTRSPRSVHAAAVRSSSCQADGSPSDVDGQRRPEERRRAQRDDPGQRGVRVGEGDGAPLASRRERDLGRPAAAPRAASGPRSPRVVWLRTVADAARAASTAMTSSSVAPPSPETASISSRFAVRVPVLSRHRTSTWLSDSIAFACWTSAPKRRIRIAPRA